MMKLCEETITLYNAKFDKTDDCDIYNRTLIIGVSWFREIASNVDNTGLKAANKFIIRIPENSNANGKSFLDPSAYAKATDVSGNFTLKEGDIIVHGIATEEHPIPAELNRKYNEVVTILGITDNRNAPNGKHWKVVGS